VKHSEKFKEKMVAKMTGPSRMSANALSKECGVGQPTLSKWLRDARVPAMAKRKPTRGKRWTAEEKLRVVLAAASAGESGLGEVLRREGLHEADLGRFRAEALEGLREKPARVQESADAKRVKELEKELRRKEKALAETAAILVLRKKLSAFFSAAEEGDTNEENDK
jgi:transposase-like protein